MDHAISSRHGPHESRSKSKRTASRSSRTQAAYRIPGLGWIPNKIRNHFVASAGEFAGTFLFLFFAFSGTQVANTQTQGQGSTTISQAPNPAQLLYISLCFGFSLAVNVWVFFRISGGLFNPAVSFGMVLVGALPPMRGVCLFVAQILAAISSAAVVSCLFPGPLNVQTSLGGGASKVQGLFIEMFLTAELVFTIFMLAAEKHKGTFIAPVGIGLSLFIAELTGVYYTGGSLNPARSFGPSVVLHQFFDYHWIYWIGPLLGTLLASGFYKFIKALEYETANPGQDLDDKEAQVFDPEVDVTRPNVVLRSGEWVEEPITPGGDDEREGNERFGNKDGVNNDEGFYGQQAGNHNSKGSYNQDAGNHNGRGSYNQDAGIPMQERPHRSSTGSARRNSGSRRGPTYPPVEGAVNYDHRAPARTSLNSYRAGPEAEAGRYPPRSSGR